jgi:hypothetical protein
MSITHRWTYAKRGGEAYPVGRGQAWRVTDAHWLTCSDVMADATLPGLLSYRTPTLVYVDPPWNNGNLSSFYTKAALARPPYSIEALYRTILALCPRVPLYIEASSVTGLPAELPGPVTRSWATTYYGRHPSALHYTGTVPPPDGLDLAGLDDEHTPSAVLAAYPTGCVLDPCGGMGGTARAAALAGWQSTSNELNPWRMSAALHSLAELLGATPERVA